MPTECRAQGNVAVIELKLRSTAAEAAEDFKSLGLMLNVHGSSDLTVVQSGQAFLFEFKVVADAPEGQALRQIREKGYAEKYLGQGAAVRLIGVEFSRTARNIVGFEVQTITG